MSGQGRGGRNLFDRSIDLLRDVSDRVQREASRSRQVSGLKADLAGLRGQRGEALRRLGVEAYRRMSEAGEMEPGLSGLQPRVKEIDEFTARITALEASILRLETEAIGRPERAADKPQKESKRFAAGEGSIEMSLVEATSKSDPLEDILGKAADADLVEMEEGH